MPLTQTQLAGAVADRAEITRAEVNRLAQTSAVFANPLFDWTGEQMRSYRAEHRIPESRTV